MADKLYAKAEDTRHLVTAGNLGFVANNTDLYTLTRKGDKFKKRYNVGVGQLVMWSADPTCSTVPKTIAPANLDLAELADLKIGVGVDIDGDGLVDAIRSISPLNIQGCTIDALDATAPQCAVPQIKAIYPECVSCDAITARVRVYDQDSINFSEHALKAFHEFTATYVPDCSSCDDCEKTVTCDEVVCGLVDALNNDTDFKIDGDPYPHYYNTGVERPYKAFKLWNTWKSYCIAPEVGEGCTECNSIDALTTFTVDGDDFNFNLTKPGDNTQTLVAQLEQAVEAINAKFDEVTGVHGGFAFISRGQGSCCPIQLFVTTCDTTFEIAGLVECEAAVTPFASFTPNTTCKQCGTTATPVAATCGIGIFVRPDSVPCNCWDLNRPNQFLGRWVEIDLVSGSGNDNTPKYSKKATLLEGQVASGFGSEIQYLEYANNIEAIGFEGFQFDLGNDEEGWQGLPRATSRIRNAITADCNKSYCSYYLRHRGQVEYGPHKNFINKLLDGFIHVPQNDSTTKTAVEALFTKFVALVPQTCKVLTNATC
jgi:hypothetical protein